MKDNVLRGIQLLDEKMPDWRDKIDPKTLDLANDCNCVIGQLFGSYYYTNSRLDIYGPDYGFNIHENFTDKDKK